MSLNPFLHYVNWDNLQRCLGIDGCEDVMNQFVGNSVEILLLPSVLPFSVFCLRHSLCYLQVSLGAFFHAPADSFT